MKKTLTIMLLTIWSILTMAQSKFTVSGTVIEKGSNATVSSATVQVLSLPDSTFVTGAATDDAGAFSLPNVKKGRHVLKISFIGFQPKLIDLDLTKAKDKHVALGYITLSADALLLNEALVTAKAAKVQVSGDSLVFNTSAYRMAEGSKLEDLVKKLPGAQVDDEGNITINGKTVTKILVDGKEFFLNDTKMSMKNIPTEMIDKIKSYDRKSDLARITGIDDGEEETVLDLSVKKEMKNGWVGDIDLAAGTEDRYNESLNINRFTNSSQYSLIAGANNVGDRGFGGGGGRGGWWGGGNGLRTKKEVGFNYATTSEKLETGGSVSYRYDGSDVRNESSVQNFVTTRGAFSNSRNKSFTSGDNVNFNFRLEWKPDTMTNIMFRPNANYSRNRGLTDGSNATFNDDPDEYSDDPLGDLDDLITNIDNFVVNANRSRQQSYSSNRSVNGTLQLNRKLNSEGRNVTLRFAGGMSGSDSKQLSASQVDYFTADRNPDTNNRYYTTPGCGHNYSLQATYSEPIAKRTYLQFSYRFNYSYTKNDRQAFTYDDEAYEKLRNGLLAYRYDVSAILEYMQRQSEAYAAYDKIEDSNLSQYSEYKNYNHTASVMFRLVRDNYNFNVGVDALPQRSKLDYKYMQIDTAIVRNVFNFTPSLDYRYKFSKTSQLHFFYRGRTSQPSMTNLLDITDDSDPLNIRKGNPGLKPSFSSNFRLFYNTYNPDRQQGMFTHVYFSMTQNSVANMTSYDESTGITTTRPENINGNWNAGGVYGFNTALGEEKSFNIHSFTNFGYNNQVSYLDPRQYAEKKSKTKRLNAGERLELGYRNDWLEVSLNGNVTYSRSRNNVVKGSELDTWDFSYGTEMNVTFPWGTRIATDIAQNSRRGYAQSSMNTNELIWNAQVSHSFLKGKALTLSFEMNDILGNKSNISRVVTAMMSSDSRYNAINQYGMFHLIYRINIFGGKNVMGTDDEHRGPGGPGHRPRPIR